jgi:hypothetical protein
VSGLAIFWPCPELFKNEILDAYRRQVAVKRHLRGFRKYHPKNCTEYGPKYIIFAFKINVLKQPWNTMNYAEEKQRSKRIFER